MPSTSTSTSSSSAVVTSGSASGSHNQTLFLIWAILPECVCVILHNNFLRIFFYKYDVLYDHQSIWPMDDWAQPVGRFGPPDLFWLCYLFIFPAISIIIRRGFERFLVQKINTAL